MSEIPFAELPADIRQEFYYAASKGEWTSQEAYEHLVPSHLRDNPEEIRAFMNGGTFTEEVWIPDRGRASGYYEEITYEVSDKDISRIVSGKNGGEYSVENTVMEDMSINRSRGAANMTPNEYEAAVQQNEFDASVIENHFMEKSMFTDTEIITPIAEESLLDGVMGVAWDGVLPAAAAVTAGAYVGDKFTKKEDRLGYGALAAGGAALLAMTPPGQLAMLGFAGYKIFQAGTKVYKGLNTERVVQEVA